MTESTSTPQEDAENRTPTIEELAERVEELEAVVDALAKRASFAAEIRRPLGHLLAHLSDRGEFGTDEAAETSYDEDELWDAAGDVAQLLSRYEARLDRLAAHVDPSKLEYSEMTPHDRQRIIREHLVKEAQRRGSRYATLDYKEVRALFDGHPSEGTAYTDMESVGEKAGFVYEDPPGSENKRVRVDLARLKDDSLLSGAEE